MNKLLAILVSLLFLSGCASSWLETKGSGPPVSKLDKVYLVSNNKLDDDYRIHDAIIAELHNRGYIVVDLKDEMPDSVDGIIFSYKDTWSWDFVMVLSTLDIRVLDGHNRKLLGSGYWGRPFWHNYPKPEDAVSELFREMKFKNIL
ncbi:MAG: hypothetical protein HGJ93_00605 [Desulfosarcina sp.]|nr:hypothetical protein [Desulfosarcina sp.]MBC2764486.1 hypothetical protein [Desulfosarcina sp.]